MEDQEVPLVGHRKVTHDAIMRFGTLTNDHSQLHFDPAAGRAAGYGGPIAHGLLTACWAVGGLTEHEPELLSIGVPDAFLSACSLRLSGVVRADDVFALRTSAASRDTKDPHLLDSQSVTGFETVDQNRVRTSSGSLTITRGDFSSDAEAPEPWDLEPWQEPASGRETHAEALLEAGPRGRCTPHTLTEAHIEAFAEEVGERNPLYLDDAFARRSVFGARVVPPMLTFCLAFSDFLHDLLSPEMPSTGFAGHIGDEWTLLAPIHPGDVLHTRHKPLGFTPSKSHPGRAIVRFGIQIVNQQDRVVQKGETVMMIPQRPVS